MENVKSSSCNSIRLFHVVAWAHLNNLARDFFCCRLSHNAKMWPVRWRRLFKSKRSFKVLWFWMLVVVCDVCADWSLLSILFKELPASQRWPVGLEVIKRSSPVNVVSCHSLTQVLLITCMRIWLDLVVHSHPFILRCSLSLSSSLSNDAVYFVGHDLVRPRRSRLLVTGEVTLGHCAAVNFGQRDCWSTEASLSTNLVTTSSKERKEIHKIEIFRHNC